MPRFNCDKCGEGELEFEVSSGDSGDGVWLQSFDVVRLVGQTCKCEYSDAEMRELEDAALEAEQYGVAEMMADSLLSAHGY